MSTDQNIFSGDDVEVEVTLEDRNGEPLSITDASVKWALARASTSLPIMSKQSPDDITLETVEGVSIARFWISSAETLPLTGTYYHEMEFTDASGRIATVMTGSITARRTIIN